MPPIVHAVGLKKSHGVGKVAALEIQLVANHGVAGDAHAGATVKHRSRVAKDATQLNLRQVHLIHAELFDELKAKGFAIVPLAMGENITTHGLDLLGLPAGTRLGFGEGGAVVGITGLRNPCTQLDGLAPGLMQACLGRDASGQPIRKAGVMGIVIAGGPVRAGDTITVTLPAKPHEMLKPV